MMKGMFQRLLRAKKGSVMLELGAGVFVLMLFAIGVAQFASLTIDVDRDGRALRSGVDLLWQIEDETGMPTQSEIDEIGTALATLSKLDAQDRFRVHFSVFDANSSGQPSLLWTRSSGNRESFPASRASVSGLEVVVDGSSFDVADDEKLIVVEIMRDGFGMRRSGGESYRMGLAYKADSNLGP